MPRAWHILAFESTHAAMAAQKLLAHLNPFVIPTPKAITAGCGMSLRMDAAAADEARLVLAGHPDIAGLSAWHLLEEGEGGMKCPAGFPTTGDDASMPTLASAVVTQYAADGSTSRETDDIQVEHTLDVYVNEVLAMRIVCTPDHLFDLVTGRLFTEGLIDGPDDVESMGLADASTRVNVRLRNREADLSRATAQKVPTSSTTNQAFSSYFEDDKSLDKVVPIPWEPEWVFSLARQFAEDTPMHKRTSGSHSCYLAVRDEVLYCCEDLGRHNAFDKVIGCALRDGVDLGNAIVFSSGRIPVDMVLKGIRSGVPILVSKAVPTDMTIRLAQRFDLTLICSARPDSMKVFNDPLAR